MHLQLTMKSMASEAMTPKERAAWEYNGITICQFEVRFVAGKPAKQVSTPKEHAMSEVIAEASLALKAPRIGEYWEGQGGIYAGIMPGEDGQRDYHLIVSVDEGVELEWGGYGSSVEGAGSRYDGAANTKALLASSHDHPAAEWAGKYTKDGHIDFHLPAQRELNLCYATIPGKFAPDWYWTSTQSSAHGAWGQYFDDGNQFFAYKSYAGRARAVRRLFI
jgi:hypothetical protein